MFGQGRRGVGGGGGGSKQGLDQNGEKAGGGSKRGFTEVIRYIIPQCQTKFVNLALNLRVPFNKMTRNFMRQKKKKQQQQQQQQFNID